MQFQNIAIVIFALAILLFLFIRRHVITGLQADNAQLRNDHERMRAVCVRQRDEITKLIQAAEDERRARQIATLGAIGRQHAARHQNIIGKQPSAYDPFATGRPATNPNTQGHATRTPAKQEETPANRWDDPGSAFVPVPMSSPSPAHESAPAPAAAYHGGGGSFDGGGASGDYGSSSGSDSSSSSSCSSSSSDSGSSSSSDSGSSCSSD